ncbi:alpha/beta hydrolase-fold protein [Pilimelia columellifera]|uniref:Enterochelin esterase N-terminal domain-containing protein n=1 Tax=Pilimelia columellifera subsp. columellifera TaxID=706583 RepID=A0ABN3N6B9_9ACTN
MTSYPPVGDPRSCVPPDRPRPDPPPLAQSPAVAALTRDPSRLPEFWADVVRAGTPLIEPDPVDPGHVIVTFLWRGRAGEVLVLANKLTDRFDLAASRMRRLDGADLWWLSYRLPRGWRGSYHFAVRASAGHGFGWVRSSLRPDPHNDRVLPRDHGPPASIAETVALTGGRPWQARPGVPTGMLTVGDVPSARLAGARRVWRYVPAASGPYRTLVLLDGQIWGPLLPVAPLLDNLIADGALPPVVVLMPDSGEGPGRAGDYACRDAFADFLADEVISAAGLPLVGGPDGTVVAGQSLGGLAAAHAALRRPDRFGAVLTHSGAYWWPNAEGAEPQWLAEEIRRRRRAPLRWDLSVGQNEWISLTPHRRLRDALIDAGHRVHYEEYPGGHDRACWRELLGPALARVFGDGPGLGV